MPNTLPHLHIVEPTLSNEAGHCMSLVRALTDAAFHEGCHDITVWGGQRMSNFDWAGAAQVKPHFNRRWRRLQALVLYRRLLRQPGRVLVSTAGSADLVSLDWAARSMGMPTIPANKVALFVHWFNAKPGKARLFTAIAKRQPGLKVLAPTSRVVDFFAACGFQAVLVPYPLDAEAADEGNHGEIAPFRHLLVPGAARMDKGFGHVVDLVEEMQRQGLTLPICVQTSREHGHHKDEALTSALMRLQASGYPLMLLNSDAMDRTTYRALFQGAVVIQPYRASDFQDRVSGVTLDALQAGAPVVVTANTWMARLVTRYRAGVATDDLSPSGLLQAIRAVLDDHDGFAERSLTASASVRAEHSAQDLIQAALVGD